MDRFLHVYEGPEYTTRNGTDLSEFCNRLLSSFVKYDAQQASVKVADTPFGFEELYRGLWNACCNKKFSGRVRVHKQGRMILLVKKGRGGRDGR